MHKISVLVASAAVVSLVGTSHAVSVEVDSTKPEVTGSVYTTIANALDYVKTQAEPREVRITGGGPYQENISANFSVTIKGDGYRPVIAAPPTAGLQNGSLNGNAVAFYTTADFPGDQAFTLENMVILPQVGNAPTRGIRTNNNNSTDQLTPVDMTVNLEDVLITSNNGSDQPVSTDGLSTASMTGATKFADDICWFAGFVDVNTTNTIITNVHDGTASVDGIVFYPDEGGYELNLGPGTIISYLNRMAVQMVSDGNVINMRGTKANPVIIKGNLFGGSRNSAISLFNADGGTGASNHFENVVFVENNSRPIGLSLVTAPGTTGMGLEADNVAFVNNVESAVLINSNLTLPWNFTNTTFVNNGLGSATGLNKSAIYIGESTAGNNTGAITFTDSIIAGNGRAKDGTTGSNLIDISAPNMPISFVNTAIVNAGPYALATGNYELRSGATAPTETDVINADPQFGYVGADFTDPNFLDVNATAYHQAGTASSDLSGYGDYVGGSSVEAWMSY